jgi:hypothetical protein
MYVTTSGEVRPGPRDAVPPPQRSKQSWFKKVCQAKPKQKTRRRPGEDPMAPPEYSPSAPDWEDWEEDASDSEPEPEPEPESLKELAVEPLPMEPVVQDPVTAMHELIFRAASMRSEERWVEAISLYRDAIERGRKLKSEGPVLADLYTGKGECHEALAQWDELEFDLSAALRLGGSTGFQLRWRRSAVLCKLERFLEAKRSC